MRLFVLVVPSLSTLETCCPPIDPHEKQDYSHLVVRSRVNDARQLLAVIGSISSALPQARETAEGIEVPALGPQ